LWQLVPCSQFTVFLCLPYQYQDIVCDQVPFFSCSPLTRLPFFSFLLSLVSTTPADRQTAFVGVKRVGQYYLVRRKGGRGHALPRLAKKDKMVLCIRRVFTPQRLILLLLRPDSSYFVIRCSWLEFLVRFCPPLFHPPQTAANATNLPNMSYFSFSLHASCRLCVLCGARSLSAKESQLAPSSKP